MGKKRHTQTTEELLSLGMALHADRETMETRIRGIFSREKSMRIAAVTAVALTMALAIACFTTACLPVTRSAAETEKLPAASPEVIIADSAEEALLQAGVPEDEIGSLLHFDGYAQGDVDGDTITVTDGKGREHVFTWVDEGIRERSEPIPEGTYATPAEVARNAAEVAVTVSGDAVQPCEIHINMYKNADMDLVYYGIGFGGTPFETAENAFGYADAVTGTVLLLDTSHWSGIERKYGNDTLNKKMEEWDWSDERYAQAHTSEKALATAMELIHTCFATAEIVPPDPEKLDGGSHTDGEQIDWDGGYEAIVDAYIRMNEEPCYYVQVAVPLEEGPEPCVTIFGCYPLGWEYCCNQIHDPAVLRQEMLELAEIRAGRTREQEGAEGPFPTEAPDGPATITEGPVVTEPETVPETFENELQKYADLAESMVGTTFTPRREDWKPGDSASEYSKIFAVHVGAYLDDGYEDSEPTLDANEVLALSKRGNVLRFEYNGHFVYGICVDAWNMVWADAATMTVRKAPVAEWMAEKPDCTCSVLTWDW